MACIITYENKQYTQKEFEQYFKEHFTEFVDNFLGSKQDIEGFKNYVNNKKDVGLTGSNPDTMDIGLTGKPTKRPLEAIASSFNMLNTGYLSNKIDVTQVRQTLDRNGYKFIGIKSSGYGYYFTNGGKMVNPYKKTIKALDETPLEDTFGLTGRIKVTDHVDVFEKVIDRYESQIKLLKKRLGVIAKQYGTVSIEAQKQLSNIQRLIKDKENKIEDIKENRSYTNLLQLAQTQAKEIELELRRYTRLSTMNLSEEALKYYMERLVELSLFIHSWEDINTMLPTKITDELHASVQAIYGTYKGFKSVYIDLIKTYFSKITAKISYDTIDRGELFKAIEDTSWMVMGTMSAAHSTSDLVKVTKDIIDYARDKAHVEFMGKKRRIEALDLKLETLTGKKGKEKWEIFLQKRKDGTKTGNFINQYSQEYYDIIEELNSKRAKGELSTREYYAERRKYEDIISHDDYKNRVIGTFTEEDYLEQDRLMQMFENAIEIERQVLIESELFHNSDGTFKDVSAKKAFENAINAFIHERNPFGFGSLNHLYKLPPKPKAKYMDKSFLDLFKPENKALLEVYLEMMDILRTNNATLPISMGKHKEAYIPEQLAGKKIDMSVIGKWGKDLIIEQISNDIDDRITIGDKTIKSVPITMMGNKLSAEEKSYDIKQVLINHTAMAMNYKHLSSISPIAEAAVDILDEMEEIKIGKSGEATVDSKNITHRKKGRLSSTKQHLQNTIDVLLYQERTKTEGKLHKLKPSKEIQDQIDALDEKLERGEITQEEYDIEIKKIPDEYITVSRITDSLIRYTYLKALSFPNIAAPAVNLFFGLMSNLTYAAGGVDFTTNEIMKATGMMMQAVSKSIGGKLHPEAVERIYGWMERLNVLGEVNESLYSHKRTLADKAVFLQVHAEKVNQGSVMIAMLKTQKVKDVNGNEIPLWEAYTIENGELVWDYKKMGVEESVDIYRFKKKVEAVIHRIHGDYTSPMGFKRYALGRAMLLFRTWIPAAIHERFGKESFNHDLGRETKGRYRSLLWATDKDGGELNFPQIMKRLGKSLLFMDGTKDLSAVDKENLQRDLREMIIVASLSIVALMLRSLAAQFDDDDEEEWGLNYMSNILGKTTSDIIGFAWPGAMTQVLSNPITLMKTVIDLSEIYPAVSKTIQGDPEYKNGPWKGHNRIGKWVTYQIPGLYGVAKTITAGEKIYEFY